MKTPFLFELFDRYEAEKQLVYHGKDQSTCIRLQKLIQSHFSRNYFHLKPGNHPQTRF